MSSGRPGASSQGEDGDSQFDDGSVGSGEYDDARLSGSDGGAGGGDVATAKRSSRGTTGGGGQPRSTRRRGGAAASLKSRTQRGAATQRRGGGASLLQRIAKDHNLDAAALVRQYGADVDGAAGGAGATPDLAAEVADLRRANAALAAAVRQLVPSLSARFETLESAVTSMVQGQADSMRLLKQALAASGPPQLGNGAGGGAAGAGAGAGSGSVPVAGGGAAKPLPKPKKRNAGTMHLWTGTWNMSSQYQLEQLDPEADRGEVARLLEAWVPANYDVYVLAVQECVGDGLYAAFAEYTGTYQLPLNFKLSPAREDATTQVRSRRMGHAINVGQLMSDVEAGLGPDPVVTAADMLDRVRGGGHFTGMAVFVSPVVAPYVRLLGVYKHGFGALEGSHGACGSCCATLCCRRAIP